MKVIAAAVIAVVVMCYGCKEAVDTGPKFREVECSACGGDGKVYYGPEDDVVKYFGAAPGEYDCWACGGSGRLLEEP